jgi:uncharacterized membrane protein YoaK (UPF0700 family)
MISRLPRWIEFGGFCLAMVAGSANAVGWLGFAHQAISHLTGTATLIGVSIADAAYFELAHLTGIILAFVAGAVIAGALVGNVALKLGRPYGIALAIESFLLLLATLALLRGFTAGQYLASAACGLQNGLVSTFSGATVRTTHVSGLFTDLGTMLGARTRGHPVNGRQAKLFLILIAGFVFGGIVGAAWFSRSGYYAMLFPALGAGVLAVAYRAFRLHRNVEAA